MYRIDTSTALSTQPAISAAGTGGFFTNGNAVTGVAATVVDADWLNGMQEELMSFLTAANLTPVKGTNNQVLTAARMLTGLPTVMVQTQATGNFTVPAGVYRIRLRFRGGGGGGGAGGSNSTSAVSAGGGGAAGAFLDLILAVQPGNNVSWVIGAAGSPGTYNGSSGTAGGDTIVYLSGVEVARAKGGTGGANATSGGVGQGGTGGSFSVTASVGGYEGHTGPGGGYGVYAGVSQGWGGVGAPSYGYASVQVTGQNTTGLSGSPGGGGSGGTGESNGGAGTAGELTYEYC
ncbi:glycine-rich domain-containing protein [Gluconobacter morbifer]|uniref:Glycine-rich domain-containing protein n=1 Tax=Gluconobacter morbifer G707 TaxID=1088869 RepID=G6XIR1_9PROT|nr:hypothetical protein [Gluconobacter morbifer]EHH68369.1 hypothetical protein GMO_11390 [Gluconobacter morbifer G707]